MSVDPQALDSESCQLESRYWIITDESGKKETVNGLGVVGDVHTLQIFQQAYEFLILILLATKMASKAQNRYG